MTKYYVEIKNVMGLKELSTTFDFSERKTIVLTGKNGSGKTTLVKAFKLISDPQVFVKTSSMNSIGKDSSISFKIDGVKPFSFTYNDKLKVLDTKQALPSKNHIRSELPIPYGERFEQFSLVAKYDSEIRSNIASSNYVAAEEILSFLSNVYKGTEHLSGLLSTKAGKNDFYFILQSNNYYIREDHFSSGEFFLIQLYRLITSEAKLIIIDEVDISLDASAQVHFFSAVQPLLEKYNAHLIVVSHSLAFMEMVDNGCLYYHERQNGVASLEQRSFGYIKSDLYGFIGRDRYIITEDNFDGVLPRFIEYLIRSKLKTFYKYEIIPAGGQPQVVSITNKNDNDEIFGKPDDVIIIVDNDMFTKTVEDYNGTTKVYHSPVDDIELYIWNNKDALLSDVTIEEFTAARSVKKTAKTYWKKLIRSGQKSHEDLFQLVAENNKASTKKLIEVLQSHLCL